ncbi:MAG TPA: cell envelope integrity protein CreD [Opitutus sp.]|nr:cell envelope integrity protein CreD [Opitutus sp.]
MNSVQPPVLVAMPAKRRLFVFLKLASICVLIALLHVPLLLTKGVLEERQSYQAQATEEIARTWGRQQLVTGPVLAVPYGYQTNVIRSKVVNGKAVQVEETELATATAYFLPEDYTVEGAVDPEVRRRGIYETVVYSTRLALAGHFRPDLAAAGIEADRVDWERARVYVGLCDLGGLRSVSALDVNDPNAAVFESAEGGPDPLLPLSAKVAGAAAGGRIAFAMTLGVQGSEYLQVAPVGRTTTIRLSSSWSDPSFVGASLPATRSVTAEGFRAEWQSSHFSRGFPQAWTSRNLPNEEISANLAAAGVGVRFAQGIDGYSLTERAQKYGLLFFVLTFTVFFLFEVTAGLKIHPLQYALVGVALCLFFLGFLALSEFWSTTAAYAAAAGLCTAMVSLYAHTFLRTGRRTLVIAGGLGATYGYLYFVLKSQDYALLAGTAALFGALALVMFCTRRINWYALEVGEAERAPAK